MMNNGFYESMGQKGFSYNTTNSIKKFKCPYCGFEFSLVYARTFACQGCSEANKGCTKVRCAKCDTEFWIKEMPNVYNDYQQRDLAQHISGIVKKYNDDMGYVHNR